jgi:hypothetical protein
MDLSSSVVIKEEEGLQGQKDSSDSNSEWLPEIQRNVLPRLSPVDDELLPSTFIDAEKQAAFHKDMLTAEKWSQQLIVSFNTLSAENLGRILDKSPYIPFLLFWRLRLVECPECPDAFTQKLCWCQKTVRLEAQNGTGKVKFRCTKGHHSRVSLAASWLKPDTKSRMDWSDIVRFLRFLSDGENVTKMKEKGHSNINVAVHEDVDDDDIEAELSQMAKVFKMSYSVLSEMNANVRQLIAYYMYAFFARAKLRGSVEVDEFYSAS